MDKKEFILWAEILKIFLLLFKEKNKLINDEEKLRKYLEYSWEEKINEVPTYVNGIGRVND